jgi:hypothetical protein
MANITLSEIFDQVKGFDEENFLRKLVADKGFLEGGIIYHSNNLYNFLLNLLNHLVSKNFGFFEIVQLQHLVNAHKLLNVKELVSGWLTDFVCAGFEQETKESLLKLTLASFNKYIDSIDVSLAKEKKSEKIGTYIFMIAYLNTIRNGEFSYDAFFSDVEFLSNKVLDKSMVKNEELERLYNPIYIICNALPNTVDLASRYTIDAEKINADRIQKYSDINDKNIPSVDLMLMQQLFTYKLLLSKEMFDLLPEQKRPSKYTEKGDVLFNLDINPEQLNTILSNVFAYALKLQEVQQGQRLEVYRRIKQSKTPEEWQKETSKINGKQITPSSVLEAGGKIRSTS